MASLDESDWRQVRGLFDQLADLSEADQALRLAETGLSERIIAETRTLLHARRAPGILDTPLTWSLDGNLSATTVDAVGDKASLAAGARIGVFEIDSLLGTGGMGEVFLAHRVTGGFEQRVAIKLLRGADRARMDLFDAERRIVAGLEHPGIARLIDGGLTVDGLPYMALEYVEGEALTQWCDVHAADLNTRLNLFLQVCDAVAYAHAHLVVHQDIKPSNILVDSDARPRLLDFGIAQMVETAAGDTNRPILMTPDYAAPEQLGGASVTTATDIFSLGALLFELLCGQAPWPSEAGAPPSLIRRMLDRDPGLPSQRAEANPRCPVQARLLRGDLDALVMKAMRAEPSERYASVADLAADVRNFLAHKPLRARPASMGYIAKRFVRRHAFASAATAIGMIILIAGVAGVAWQGHRAAVERDIARAEVARTGAVNQALVLMFRSAGETDKGGDTSAKAMLDQSAKNLIASFGSKNPQTANVVLALSDLYGQLEDQIGQEALLTAALQKGVGANDPGVTARLRLTLAQDYIPEQRLDQAKPLLAQAAAVFDAHPERYTRERLELRGAQAAIDRLEGRMDDGIKILEDDMPEVKRVYADDPRELLANYNNLILHLIEANRIDEAGKWLDEAEAQIKAQHQEKTQVAIAIGQMRGAWYSRKGDKAQALKAFQAVATTRRALYGPSSGLAVDLLQVGRTLEGLNRITEALPILEEGRSMARQYMGPTNVVSLMYDVSLCSSYSQAGEIAKAEAACAEGATMVAVVGKSSPPGLLLLISHAALNIARKQPDAASRDLDQAEIYIKALGPAGAAYEANIPPLRARIAQMRAGQSVHGRGA